MCIYSGDVLVSPLKSKKQTPDATMSPVLRGDGHERENTKSAIYQVVEMLSVAPPCCFRYGRVKL